jgi:hypothetical protein
MHSVEQDSLNVGHSVANIQTRGQKADNVVFRQASLLRRFLQSLYGNKDGYSVFGFQDCQSSSLICAAQKRQLGTDGRSPGCSCLALRISKLKNQPARDFLTTEQTREEWQTIQRLASEY